MGKGALKIPKGNTNFFLRMTFANSTTASLTQSVDKVSDIDKKVSQIDNMRSMIASLSHPLIKHQRLIQK